MRTLVGLAALVLFLATAQRALAEGPAELAMSHGALAVGDQILFVSAPPAQVQCPGSCSATPFIAAPGAVAGGLWALLPTEAGPQWAYDGQPLFVWPEIGVDFGHYYFGYDHMADYYGLRPAWVRDPVDEGLALAADDIRVAVGPRIERRALVNYGLYSDSSESGRAEATICVDRWGAGGPVAITFSSGSPRLDALTIEFAQKIQFLPARVGSGEPVAVCGVAIIVDWPSDTPASLRRGRGALLAPAP